ncbi:WD40 domain-containing protein [Trifolium repens]|nr:WD40 domain-containing protein [Trifolium repens]
MSSLSLLSVLEPGSPEALELEPPFSPREELSSVKLYSESVSLANTSISGSQSITSINSGGGSITMSKSANGTI